MFKKLFYFPIIMLFFFIFDNNLIKGKEYCHIYQDEELLETLELPFYLYKLNRDASFETNGFPNIIHTRTTTYIDSMTKCELINIKIDNDSNQTTHKATVLDYSNEHITIAEWEHFYQAKISKDKSIIKGLSTRYDEEPPTINGYKDKYITNIDAPISLNLLMASITAYDNLDGNITDKIKIEYNEYSKNIDKTGTYPIIISVEDNAKNKATITIHIQIIDTTPPAIEGKNTYTSFMSSPLNLDEIKNNLIATDNTNEDLTSQIFACNDMYSANKNKIGTYSIYFCVYDPSNNLSNNFKVNVEVKDDIPPIIEGLNYFTSHLSAPLTIKDILYSLAASDNGNDISSSIFITNDNYSNFLNTIGEKTIYFQAMDSSNNLSKPFKVTINLIDDIPPQIYGLNIYNSYLSSTLSLTYLKQQLTVLDNVEGNISNKLEIISDSYSNNINNKGIFHLSFKACDSSNNCSEEFKISINIIDDIIPYFIGPSSLIYKLEQKPSLETILGQYSLKDNCDDNLNYEIIEENYSTALSSGTYYIHLAGIDSSNNKSSPFIIKIDIVEELINFNEISMVLPTSTLLSIEKINKLINLTSNYTILEDTYTPNYFIEGNYLIKYELKDKSLLSLTITTYNFNKKDEETKLTTKIKKETFINKIKRFFLKIFNYFKKLFNKINPLKVFQCY